MIQGQEVILISRTEIGKDDFNAPIYKEVETAIKDVLIAPQASTEAVETTNLEGAMETYQLAIPKGDTNTWEGNLVKFWDKTWKVTSPPTEGMDENIPLRWNKKVTVERYE